MRLTSTKKFIVLIAIFSWWSDLFADEYTNYFNNSSLDRTTATGYAIRTAGAAKACGQDISEFLTRLNQALDRMTFNSADKVLAEANFQDALIDAEQNQIHYHTESCERALREFNGLSLMRADYQTTVLPNINPNSGQANPISSAPNPAPAPSSIGDNAPPNINTLAPGGTPPPPDSPIEPNPPNINHQAPSIGPFVDITKPSPNINDIAPNPWTQQNPPTQISNPYSNPTPPRP